MVVAPGDRQLEVSWDEPVRSIGLADYDVDYRCASSWTEWNPTETSTRRSTTITGLTNGILCDVRVWAHGAGSGPVSGGYAYGSGTPKAPVDLSEPRNVVVAPGDRQLEVSWDEPVRSIGLADYDVDYRCASSWTEWNPTETSTRRSTTITGLTNGILCDVRVWAHGAGSGPVSGGYAYGSGTPKAPVDLSEPRNVVVAPGDRQLEVSWDEPVRSIGLADYDVDYRCASSWTEWNPTETSTRRSTTITGLTNGILCDVRVWAHGAGSGPVSGGYAYGSGTPKAPRLPRPESSVADGRCAHVIKDGIYDWEDCAWSDDEGPVTGRVKMQALTDRVWDEVMADGKPTNPPALVEGQCRSWLATACYIPYSHIISIESGVTLRTILHELAHALIADDPVIATCYLDWTSTIPNCAHGPLFRCAADFLYQRYADIDPAGVCGTVPDYGVWTKRSGVTFDGPYTEWRTSTDGWAAKGGTFTLAIRCAQGQRTVFANGSIAYSSDFRAPHFVEYRFGGQSKVTKVAVAVVDNPDEGDTRYGDWWVLPDGDADKLLAALSADLTNRLFVRMTDKSGVEGEARIKTTGWSSIASSIATSC